MAFKKRGEQTVLESLYQQGCYQARFPGTDGTQPVEAVLINTSGGLTDGDALFCTATWQAATTALVTTQAAERIYRSRAASARIETDLRIGDRADACWLPQETILFEGGRLNRSTTVEMAGSASLFAAEIVVLGRFAMGEIVGTGRLSDRWQIRCDDQLVFADAVLVDDTLNQDLQKLFARATVAGGASCFATLVCVREGCGESVAQIRNILEDHNVIGGASDLGRLVVVRILASSSQYIRGAVAAIFKAVQGDAMQLPRVWNC